MAMSPHFHENVQVLHGIIPNKGVDPGIWAAHDCGMCAPMLPCFCAQGWRRTRRDAQDLEALIDGKNLSFNDAFKQVGDAFLLPALPRPPSRTTVSVLP